MTVSERRIAVVCASNQNRSVEAHALLVDKGFTNVHSFGTGSNCKLPGPSIDKPNVYPFGTPYQKIYDDLKQQNPELYKANGLLNMLERNAKVKEAPQRWQDDRNKFEIVITFEDRVYDSLVADLLSRTNESFEPVHVFNLNTKDTHDEAAVGAGQALQLLQMIDRDNWDENVEEVLEAYHKRTGKHVLHQILFY